LRPRQRSPLRATVTLGKCNAMSQFLQRKPPVRAPRANLGGMVTAVVRLENGRQLSTRLQKLSITGGLLDLAIYLEERTWVELILYLNSGAVHTTAEMMFPRLGANGYRQPFRFVRMGAEELHAVDREVTELLKRPATGRLGDPGLRAPRYYLESW
jgi:hypothetical protein